MTRRNFLNGSLAATALAGVAGGSAPPAAAASPAEEAPALAFTPARDFREWQVELRRRLADILALPGRPGVPLSPVVGQPLEKDGYRISRIQFTAEPGEVVPGYLLRPKTPPPHPVMICLQGHSPGMHISIGQARNERERESIAGGRDIALQAVAHGWAALAIEQRAFGERAQANHKCADVALHAIHRGRPLVGQRVFDVMRAIDFIETQPGLDATRIGCMGNSGGGTASFYAACVEPRITLAVVSCAFCTYEDSWLSVPHCACGYLPGIMKVADMPDLAGLIAPRHLLIVAAKHDNVALFTGVEKGFPRAREIFAAAGAAERVRLVVGEGGHQFYPDLAWPAIAAMVNEA